MRRRVRICGKAVGGRGVIAGVAQQAVDIAGADVLALANARVELFQHLARRLACRGGPVSVTTLPCACASMPRRSSSKRQMSVVFAEQPVQMPVVLEGHDQARLRRSEPACPSPSPLARERQSISWPP